MKNKAVLLLAVCALVFSAAPAGAATIVEACAAWEGTWTFTFTGDKTDTVTINSICSKEKSTSATPECMPEGSIKNSWLCVARGKKQSDNQTVQIRQISMDATVYGYYESTDEEILRLGSDAPYDKISAESYVNNCAFTTVDGQANAYGLKSGQKDDCTVTTTTTTTTQQESPCPAQKVLGENNPDLENLRAFRDGPLAGSIVGRKMTGIYYAHAASINAALDRSPALRAAARKILETIAPMVGMKQ